MGLTSFSGPAFGAKTLLFSVHKDTVATAQTDLEIFEIDVPTGEDWHLTNVAVYADVAGSAAATIDVEAATTSVLSAAITCVADDNAVATVATDAGEFAGKRVAAGTAITVDITTGTTTAPEDISVHVYGFIRYAGNPQ